MCEWIPVSERLPEPGQQVVLGWDHNLNPEGRTLPWIKGDNCIPLGRYDPDDSAWETNLRYYEYILLDSEDAPTHWMLPDPPSN